MTDDDPKADKLVPALLGVAAIGLVMGGLALWHRNGLVVWLEQAIAFCT